MRSSLRHAASKAHSATPTTCDMKSMKSFVLLALLCLINAHAVLGHNLHELSVADKESFLAAIRGNEGSTAHRSRKLLAGTACLAHVSKNWYYGSCGAFANKDESHWCSSSVSVPGVVAPSNVEICLGQSEDDCCVPNGGAIAGLVIGLIVGIVGIVTLCAWCCKCCCFRPKQMVVVQGGQPAPQIVVVPSASPAGK